MHAQVDSQRNNDSQDNGRAEGRRNGRSERQDNAEADGGDNRRNATAKAGNYPPLPGPFFRGNDPRFTNSQGFYFHFWKLLLVILLFILWSKTSYWVDDDSRGLKSDTAFWSSTVLIAGGLGFLFVFCMPSFLLGFFILAVAYGAPLGLYIRERNAKVPPSSRVMTPEHIQNLTLRYLARMGIRIGGETAQQAAIGPEIRFVGKSSTGRGDDPSSSRRVENSRGFLAAKELVHDAVMRRATDVHLEPKEDECGVRLRIDGVMYPTEGFDRAIGDAVLNIFKVLGAMDITEKRRPQDGSFRAIMPDREIDFRLASQGTRHGEKMSLRILDQTNSVGTLAGLGIRKQLVEKLSSIVKQPHGLFLCCGPTGAGKSTTLFAALHEIDPYQRNIITIEDPVEYRIDNVSQIEINQKAGQTFAESLRSILRQDPDVVMIGEIRDAETARIACQAANTGHMVFSTVHANDTFTALYRLMDLGVEPFMLASSLSALLAQRLARRLCPECKESYQPNPEFLKKANLPPEKVKCFYRQPKNPEIVCPACGGLGYKGRISVVELLDFNERMRDMIRDAANMSQLKASARKNGMLYMKEEGLRLVVKGITSIDELLRVVK
ncbi:MAG: GspE/PulE family protein [Planctomycetes bacterium]|nr:GspE/PulE family protein [Planctomycetota bacterium]MCH9725467.1 GspE/PulE family protein [Planctomycetota bacterium]MCH9776564.1 GspE/PulE family protein [Planctomycetota bacterium]